MQRKFGRPLRRMMTAVVCIVLFIAALLIVLDVRSRPILREYAAVQAKTETGLTVNRVVGEIVCRTYATFLDMTCDDSGRVLSVRVNEQALNAFKAQVAQAVLTGLASCESLPVSVPIGSILGGSLLTGRGPLLRFPVHTNCTAVVTLENRFTAAGINQTQHVVNVVVDVDIAIVLSDGVLRQSYRQTCVIGQTVLLGEVPQIYIGNGDSTALQRVLGYTNI